MSDLLFFAGGECVSRHGTIVWRESEAQDNASTFTRAQADAAEATTYVGGSERVVLTDANIPRVSWNDGTSSLLIEKAHDNLHQTDAVSSWTDNQTSGTTITSNVSDPAGGTGAYTITGATGGASRGRSAGINAFSDTGIKSAVFVIKEGTMPSSGNQMLGLEDSGSTAWRLRLTITGWVAGKPTITATTGTHLGSRYIGSGFWAVYGATTSCTHESGGSAVAHRVYVYSNESSVTCSGDCPAITVYRVNVYNDVVPRYSLISQSGDPKAETFYADFVAPPQAMTVYAKFQDAGTLANSLQGIVHIGGSGATTGARFQIVSPSATAYGVLHGNGVDASITANITSSAVWANVVELRGVLNADGSVLIGQSLDSGTETTNSTATTRSLASAWNDSRIYIGSRGTATQGVGVYQAVKVARGEKTMAEMRAL
jgi:hypothetical protein